MNIKHIVLAASLVFTGNAIAQDSFYDEEYRYGIEMCDRIAGIIMDAYTMRHAGFTAVEITDAVYEYARDTNLLYDKFTVQNAGDLVHNWVYIIPRQPSQELMDEAAGAIGTEFYNHCVTNVEVNTIIRLNQ